MRSFQRPQDAVRAVFEATATLLGSHDMRMPVVRKALGLVTAGSGAGLPDKLRGVDLDAVSLSQFRRVQRLLLSPEFDEDIQGVCKSAVPLAVWCRSIATCLAKTRFRDRSEASALLAAAQPTDIEELAVATAHALPATSVVVTDGGAASTEEQHDPLPEPPQDEDLAAHEHRGLRRFSPQHMRPHSEQQGEEIASHADHARDVVIIKGLHVSPDITRLDAQALTHITELSVSRPEVGSITFHGVTDCADMDLEALVHLEKGEVLVYPVPGSKPPVGQGLNKRATVTMFQCWPPNGRGYLEDTKAQERYRWKIQQMTEEKSAKFIDYDCNTGVWTFQVDHF